MKNLSEYSARLDRLLLEQAGELSADDKEAAVTNAVAEHSRLRPQKKPHEIPGDGAAFDFPLGAAPGPLDWEPEFSKILRVEYPAGRREPVYLEDEDWQLYHKTTGQVLRLLSATPSAAEKILLTYTARHAVTMSSGTVPDADFEAVCHLAAAYALSALANRYLHNQSSTLSADVVDHKSKSADAAAAARRERGEYFAHLGIKEGDAVTAGMAFKDHDVDYPWGGDRLTHPRRQR